MKRIFCLFLILIMFTAIFCGCEKTESIVGDWNTQIDLSKALQEILKTETSSDLTVSAKLTFREDGSFSLAADQKSLEKALDTFLDDLKDSLKEKDENGNLDKILSFFGTNTDAIADALQGDLDLEDLAEQASISGFYKTVGNHLFLFQEKDSKLPGSYIEFQLEGDTLTLNKHIGANPFATENIFFRALPITFTKA